MRIVVPFAPGGNTDGIARLIAQPLGETFGQLFVVENRPGAAGAIAAEAVARAPADGQTLLMGTPSQIAIIPAMTKTPYDPVKDLAPISVVGTNPYVLVVHAGIPVRTLAELAAYARRQPDKLAYAAPVFGGLSHLSMLLFLKRAGLEMTPVSYKGGAAPLADVVAGHVPIYFATLSEAVSQARGGAIRLLAVSSENRVPQIADVPTFAKSLTWNGLMAPAGVPKETTDRIAKEVARAVKDAKFAERLAAFGIDPLGNTPVEFAAMIAADIAMWSEAIKIAGVQEKRCGNGARACLAPTAVAGGAMARSCRLGVLLGETPSLPIKIATH